MISLKEIDKPEILNEKQHEIILSFLSKLIVNSSSIKDNKNIFCYKEKSDYKILDSSLSKRNTDHKKKSVRLETKALATFMLGKSILIDILGDGVLNKSTKKGIKKLEEGFISKNYLYPFFQDKQTVSDHVLYMWNDIISKIQIQLISDREINMYFIRKPMDMFKIPTFTQFAFETYLDFDREKLLQKEIELGYFNKIIGDPDRGYGYTHLFRSYLGDRMIMPANAIRLIMNWSRYNCYLTSRKQGKTSFAADRVVCELLSQKPGYGMRQTRKIKFFTDNASKVGAEVMDYIKDYLGELKLKEVKKGVKYFDISDSEQRVTCNLTGNSFSVVSLNGLKGDSDNSTGDGLACDFAIIDEGFRIIYRFWKSFKDRAFEECDSILFISTLNEETEITHWGYSELIKGEAGFHPDYNTVRSSDFDNSITYYNNFKRRGKSLESYYKYIWEKLYEKQKETNESYIIKRMLCGIISESVMFDITGRTVAHINDSKREHFRVIGADMGGSSDHFGLCIYNAVTSVVEKCTSEHKKYEEILPSLKELKEEYPNCIIVGDRGGPIGESINILDKEKIIDYWIKNDGNISGVNEKDNYFILNKGVLVLGGEYALNKICKIYIGGCSALIEQFGNMEAKKSTRSNKILYKGKGKKKDDAVFAYLNVFGFLRIVLELFDKTDIVEYAKFHNETEIITYDQEDFDYYSGDYIY